MTDQAHEREVSIVMAVRNAAATVELQLVALAAQVADCSWELVVSDNGSSDDTPAIARSWAGRLPLRVVDSSARRGVAYARNVGVAHARGRRILMCDGDDMVCRTWVDSLATALAEHDLVTGPLDFSRLNPALESLWRDRPQSSDARVAHGYLRFAPTCNIGFRRELFDALGGFDVTLQRGEDMDFSWRALRAGADMAFVPGAVVHQRLRPSRRAAAHRGFSDGMVGPLLFRRHRSWGAPREPRAEVLASYRYLVRRAGDSRRSAGERYRYAYDLGQRLGRLVGSVRHRALFP